MMNRFIFILMIVCFNNKLNAQSLTLEEKILLKVFTERIFYEYGLDLSYIDTIKVLNLSKNAKHVEGVFCLNIDEVILSPTHYFDSILIERKPQKKLIILQKDIIPYPYIMTTMADFKIDNSSFFRNYFILEDIKKYHNTYVVQLYKILSNLRLYFTYVVKNNEIVLVNSDKVQW